MTLRYKITIEELEAKQEKQTNKPYGSQCWDSQGREKSSGVPLWQIFNEV